MRKAATAARQSGERRQSACRNNSQSPVAAPAPAARRLERIVAWRCRVLALPYGDQSLLIARSLYRAVGGFAPLPLMEDVDLVRRLGRRRLARIGARCISSPQRYRREGYWRRPLRNLFCLSLYFAGVSPYRIMRLYR